MAKLRNITQSYNVVGVKVEFESDLMLLKRNCTLWELLLASAKRVGQYIYVFVERKFAIRF